MNTNESIRRTREIEEFSNLYFIHPIAARLTPMLAALRITPNSVSLTGMLCGILAGWAYFHYQEMRYAGLGFALMIGWHILDGVDGQLARLTNQHSEIGKVIDGTADTITFLAVYVGLGLSMSASLGALVWPVIALAGLSHALQSATFEFQRQEYDAWGWGKEPVEFKSTGTTGDKQHTESLLHRMTFNLGANYARVQRAIAPGGALYRNKLANAQATPAYAEAARRQYRKTFSPLVRNWSVMSSNYHTLLIFICAALHKPLWYFFIEMFGLTALTLVLLQCQKLKIREFSRFLDYQAL